MKQLSIYFLLLACTAFISSCNEDEELESIDYNILTEQRIMEVSEQASISDEDISSLENLLNKVTDNTVKARLSGLLDGVKLIQVIIPGLEELRTNPDINFNDEHAELETKLDQVSDELPRKDKLQQQLKEALDNYNVEEYEYPEWVVNDARLGDFLAENYNIQPVQDKPNRFLRAEIEKVDSLFLLEYSNDHDGIPMTVIRTFKGLKALHTSTGAAEDVVDLNFLEELEYLRIAYRNQLKIESCQKLRHLEIVGPWGETMDFTNTYPLLETLIVAQGISDNLVNLLLSDKKHLTDTRFGEGQNRNELPRIKRLVIEDTKIDHFAVRVGSDDNKEIDEIKLSGLKGGFSIIGGISASDADKVVKINKLTLSDIGEAGTPMIFGISSVILGNNIDFNLFPKDEIEKMFFTDVHFPSKVDFGHLTFSKTTKVTFKYNTQGGAPFAFQDLNKIFQKPNPETMDILDILGLSGYPGKTADLGNFNAIRLIRLTTATAQDGQLLEKLIVNAAVKESIRFIQHNQPGVPRPEVTIEYRE